MPDVPERETNASTGAGGASDRVEIDPRDGGEGVAVGPGRGADELAHAAWRPTTASERSDPRPLTNAEYSVAFSPRNLAIGLAVVAGVVAFLASRRRGRSSGHDEVR